MKTILFLVILIFSSLSNAQCWDKSFAGGYHNITLKNDGKIWTWGWNFYGQIGDGTTDNKSTPYQVGNETSWLKIDAGSGHNLAIKNNGTLWAWGSNYLSELGNGTGVPNGIPIQIGTATDWNLIFAGDLYSMAIKNNGTLWTWGRNFDGELGNGGNPSTVNVPTQIGADTNWAKINGGYRCSYAIKTNGTLWAWGKNSNGQLGNGTTINTLIPIQIGLSTNWMYQ